MMNDDLSPPVVRHDPERKVHRTTFDPTSDPASQAVDRALAAVTGRPASELDAVGTVVDPVVFDTLVRRRRQSIRLSFCCYGHEVTVDSSGEIIVLSALPDGGSEYADTIDTDESAPSAVVRAVSDLTGLDPTEMDPLYDYVDPDALDTLVGNATDGDVTDFYISFRMQGVRVAIDGDRSIVVHDESDPPV